MRPWTVVTHSLGQTQRWGRLLGKFLTGGEIIGLSGELGTGKTFFARGVAEGLNVGKEAWVRSPTFTLINEYDGRLPIYHIDLYRIGSRAELEGLNLREYLYSDGVSLIEWFEKLPAEELNEYLQVRLGHVNETSRRLSFTARGRRYESIVEALRKLDRKRTKAPPLSSPARREDRTRRG
jgi:tRNA threonylcarbamoyladenosine biosynthesis protein TsaE